MPKIKAELTITSNGKKIKSDDLSPQKIQRKVQTVARRDLAKKIDRAKTTLKKRIARLENNNLQNSPAYKQYIENNSVIAFSVKGKTTQQLQSEFWKLQDLLNMKTGTVKGANDVLRQMASNTGITYKNLDELKAKSKMFFDLADTAKNLLESAGQAAKAIDYRQIWNTVNDLIKKEENKINSAIKDVSEMTEQAEKDLYEQVVNGLQEMIMKDLENDL